MMYFGVVLGGWVGYLISGFIGAVLLIWIVRRTTSLRSEVHQKAAYQPSGNETTRQAIVVVGGFGEPRTWWWECDHAPAEWPPRPHALWPACTSGTMHFGGWAGRIGAKTGGN